MVCNQCKLDKDKDKDFYHTGGYTNMSLKVDHTCKVCRRKNNTERRKAAKRSNKRTVDKLYPKFATPKLPDQLAVRPNEVELFDQFTLGYCKLHPELRPARNDSRHPLFQKLLDAYNKE